MIASDAPKWFSLRNIPLSGYVFFAVFVLRLIVLIRLTESQFLLPKQGDMHFYNDWAQRISRGELSDGKAFYGLPGYAYLLAGLYKVLGFNPFVPGLLQALLEGGTAVVLLKIGRRVFAGDGVKQPTERPTLIGRWAGQLDRGTVIGLLAAAGWAFYLPAQSYSVILMPTAWLVFIFWWIVWQVVRRTSLPSPRWFFLHGLLIGFTAMGIATVLFLVPLIIATLFLSWGNPVRLAPRLRTAGLSVALLFAGILLGTSPAWAHNRFVAQDPVFLSAHSGVNFWIGNNPNANGYPRFPLGLRAGQQAMLKDSITGAEAAAGRLLKRSEVSEFWSAKAKAYIAANPGAWLKLVVVKVGNFWNSFQYDDLSIITSLRELGVTFPGIRFGLVAALGLAGVVLATPRFPASRWILAAILLHMGSLLSVFVTERYRLAAVPGLLLFAAFAGCYLWHSIAAGRPLRVLGCVGLLAATSLLVSARRTDAELWALDPYNSGLHALEAERLDVAERKLKLAYSYVPGNAEINFALGNLELARNNRAAARSWYANTLALDPRHEGALNNSGVLALQENRPDEALRLFAKAVEVEPNDAKSHYLLAQAALASGDARRALAAAEEAVRLEPARPEFLELRKQILDKTAADSVR